MTEENYRKVQGQREQANSEANLYATEARSTPTAKPSKQWSKQTYLNLTSADIDQPTTETGNLGSQLVPSRLQHGLTRPSSTAKPSRGVNKRTREVSDGMALAPCAN